MHYPYLDRGRLTIKEQDFLNLYFVYGQDKERVKRKTYLGESQFYATRAKLLKMIVESEKIHRKLSPMMKPYKIRPDEVIAYNKEEEVKLKQEQKKELKQLEQLDKKQMRLALKESGIKVHHFSGIAVISELYYKHCSRKG